MSEAWVGDALDDAAHAVADALPENERKVVLGVLLKLRKCEDGIARAGADGFTRLAIYFAAGDLEEARREVLRAKGHRERRAARYRSRLAAHAEREDRDRSIDELFVVMQDVGSFGLQKILPFLIRSLASEDSGL